MKVNREDLREREAGQTFFLSPTSLTVNIPSLTYEEKWQLLTKASKVSQSRNQMNNADAD